MTKKITAIIPVKANSERVPRKNVRDFADTNLLELKLDQILSAKCFDEIVVSSESKEVLDIAKSAGVRTHLRDPYYSTSHVPMSEVYSYLAKEMEGPHIAWVNVTNPLTEGEVYEEAARTYREMSDEYDSLISVSELKEYVIYQGKPVNFKPYPHQRSQDLKDLCSINFAVSILKRENLISRGTLVGDKPFLFYIEPSASRDIDYQEDFDFCEFLYKKRVEGPTIQN